MMRMNSTDYQKICDYLNHWARLTPDVEAAVFKNERLTWRALYSSVEAMACQLMDLGIEKGDRVAMLSPARNEYLISYLATLMIGGIWYGLHPRYQQQELKYLLQDGKPKIVITVDSYLELDFKQDFEVLTADCKFIEQLIVIGDQDWKGCQRWQLKQPTPEQLTQLKFRQESIQPDDGALIVFTSGTTGKPKGALLSHKNILSNISIQNKHFDFDQSSITLIHFPINHVACSTELTIGSLLAGSKIIFLDKFHPVETLETVQAEKVSIFGQIPTMFLLEFALPNFDDYDLASVKTYIWSGSSAPESMVEQLQKTGATLLTGYGLTETGGFISYSSKDSSNEELMLGAGMIDPAFEIKLVDDNRKQLTQQQIADQEIGEIALRGDCIMKGYWDKPEQTNAIIDQDDWFYTGDMARLDNKGTIYLAGRNKDMFISGGFNIYPREIEAVIERYPGISMVSVIPIADPIYQEVGKALIILNKGQSLDEHGLNEFCRQHLANFKIPKTFMQVDGFPLLANGKLDKKAILAKYGA